MNSNLTSRATDGWTGGFQCDLKLKRWGSLSSLWKICYSHIYLENWLKSARSWHLIFSFVTGVGMNLRPCDSRVICCQLFIQQIFDILFAWLNGITEVFFVFGFSPLFFFFAFFSRFLSFFPLPLRSLIRHNGKIHFFYSHVLVISFVLMVHWLH